MLSVQLQLECFTAAKKSTLLMLQNFAYFIFYNELLTSIMGTSAIVNVFEIA